MDPIETLKKFLTWNDAPATTRARFLVQVKRFNLRSDELWPAWIGYYTGRIDQSHETAQQILDGVQNALQKRA